MRWAVALAAAFLCGLVNSPGAAQEAIGKVSRIQAEASGIWRGSTRALTINDNVFRNETVFTGEGARLEVTFTDNTQVVLGQKTKLTLDTFVFDPVTGRGRIKFGVVGAFRFLSGQISMRRSEVTMRTPVATIEIRGTEFWGGPIDGQALGVFLLQGAVRVSNARGEQILSQPGQGTNIGRPSTAPGRVTFWPRDKVNRAIATVTFQ
jgi:hypothetical protein